MNTRMWKKQSNLTFYLYRVFEKLCAQMAEAPVKIKRKTKQTPFKVCQARLLVFTEFLRITSVDYWRSFLKLLTCTGRKLTVVQNNFQEGSLKTVSQ